MNEFYSLFVNNFVAVFLLIRATCNTLKKESNVALIFLTALWFSTFETLMSLNWIQKKYSILFYILTLIILLLHNNKEIFKVILIFYVFNAVAFSIILFIDMQIIHSHSILETNSKQIVIALALVMLIFSRVLNMIRRKIKTNNYIYKTIINYNGKDIVVTALYDTGNDLVDLVYDLPVIVLDKDLIEHFDIKELDTLLEITVNTVNKADRLKYVVSNKVTIVDNNALIQLRAAIAFSNNKIGNNKGFNALLPRDAL